MTKRDWTPAEDDALREMFDRAASVAESCAALHRTPAAVMKRRSVLGCVKPRGESQRIKRCPLSLPKHIAARVAVEIERDDGTIDYAAVERWMVAVMRERGLA